MGVTSDAYMIPTSPDDSARRFFFRKNSSQPPLDFCFPCGKVIVGRLYIGYHRRYRG